MDTTDVDSWVIVRSWGEYENKQNKRFNSCRNKTWILAVWLYKNDIVEEKQRIPTRSVSSNHRHFPSRVFVFFFLFVFRSISAKMGFGDLQSREGLALLNSFLADKSYIEG